jgi:hypothetical protein
MMACVEMKVVCLQKGDAQLGSYSSSSHPPFEQPRAEVWLGGEARLQPSNWDCTIPHHWPTGRQQGFPGLRLRLLHWEPRTLGEG